MSNKKILAESFEKLWAQITAVFVDDIKNIWYKYATVSWLSISAFDMISPDDKELLKIADDKVKYIQKKHWLWFLTENEKYTQSIIIWAEVKKVIESKMKWLLQHIIIYLILLILEQDEIGEMLLNYVEWND